ncbi:ATP-binding protein [Mycolicibacterium palauense]|uniref:ATP-binding protein n=1 Tax=Mycolicibacterium palauense TaxID=2034511 RepID=UPI000BFEE174|nr:adenylate/guanylate cyclase domain-containing protein [Mycolicibacterium palauense]
MSDAEQRPRVDELLDRACEAINAGDRATANVLAEQVLALDAGNAEAEDLLSAPVAHGEIRRLTIMFADLVDSTALSTRTEPEIYRTVVGRYRDDVLRIVGQFEGHIGSTKGDGLLAVFGHPVAHEDDAIRATQAGLDITRAISELTVAVRRRFGFDIAVRVGIHRGIVYLDTSQDDVYGLAANLAARICSVADPGTVAVSEAVEPLVVGRFDLEVQLPRKVKGVDDPIRYYRVLGERDVRPVSLGPLVGRDRELGHLRHSWEQVLANQLSTPGVALHGDAGIGKSRLAWSAVDLAERSHAVVLQLVGSPFHTDVGLRPFRRLLERRCGITRVSEPSERLTLLTRELVDRSLDPSTMIPLLAPILGIAPSAGYEPVQAEGRKLFELISAAVQDYLRACVRAVPALVLVEDMHWFDEDTVEAVQHLLASDLGGHVLVVMTSRNEIPFPADLVETFELRPLSDAEAEQLIAALHPDASPSQRSAVRMRCDGVPLYIEEVLAKLRELASDSAAMAGVPDSLYEALFARLRSSENSVRVVEAASIIGSRIERSLLLSAVDLTDAEVDEVMTQLVNSRVLEPLEADTWRFRHELLREVGSELAPPTLRRQLHSRIADSLLSAADSGNPDWPLIARHYENAGRLVEAATAYRHASLNAWQRGALGEARTYLTHAIAQIQRAEPTAARDRMEIALRQRRAMLAQAAEGVFSPNVAADFERCLHLCGNDFQDDDLFSTVMSLYPYYTMRADLQRAERLVRSIRASLTGPRQGYLPVNEFALGMLAWYRGDFGYAWSKMETAARSVSQQAVDELDKMLFMPNDATAGLYTHRALSRYVDGDVTAAETELAAAERRCSELPFPQGSFSLAYARQIEVLIRIEAGQLDRAAAAAVELEELGERHGFDSWAIAGTAQQAAVAALVALAEAEHAADPGALLAPHIATLDAIVSMWREVGVISLITFYDALLATLLLAAGQPATARERIRLGLELAESTGMHFYDGELLRLRARTVDDGQQRRSDLTAARELTRQQQARLFELRTVLDLFEQDPESFAAELSHVVAGFADDSCPEVVRARSVLG